MTLIYWACYIAVILMAVHAAFMADWFIFRACIGGLAVMFLTYGPPSYFRRNAGQGGVKP